MTSARYIEPPLRTAVIDGRQQSWREAGEGARLPLLLLHGIGSNAGMWAGQFPAFSDERRVVAWNAPGYDQSDGLASDWPTPDEFATAALGLVSHMKITRCIVVGQSLGAVIAVALARLAPERIAATVLVSPASGYGISPGDPLPESVASRLNDLRALGRDEFAARRYGRLLTAAASPAAHDIVRRAMAEVTMNGYSQAARLLAVADLVRDVAGLAMPTRVIWGDADVITPAEGCRRVAAAAGCVGIELKGLGHALATEAPDRFNASLRAVMAAVEQQNSSWT
jgi:pimeloyl-ACP methyl ester carboxylesterase